MSTKYSCMSFFTVATMILLAACTPQYRVVNFSALSDQPVKVSTENGKWVTGQDCRAVILGFPTRPINANKALAKALAGGDAKYNSLVDGQLTLKRTLYFGYYIYRECYAVEGNQAVVPAQ
jgi:hypothetical protein